MGGSVAKVNLPAAITSATYDANNQLTNWNGTTLSCDLNGNMTYDGASRNAMPTSQPIKVGPLKQSELEEANRIVRLAFGTFLGLTNPLDFMGGTNVTTVHVCFQASLNGNPFGVF